MIILPCANFALELHPKLFNINLHNVTHSNIPKPYGMDLRNSNLIPYCHISLPYITEFVINANHQEINAHPRIAPCGVSPCYYYSSSYATC